MRAVIQRVQEARVEVDGEVIGKIGQGFLVLLGVRKDDTEEDVRYLADKVTGLRIFEDEAGKINLSISECSFSCVEVFLISNFTPSSAFWNPFETRSCSSLPKNSLFPFGSSSDLRSYLSSSFATIRTTKRFGNFLRKYSQIFWLFG